MTVVIFPGMHAPELTLSFLAGVQTTRLSTAGEGNFTSSTVENPLIFPSNEAPVYSIVHTWNFLQKHCQRHSPLVVICFSAGGVGGAGAAWAWQQSGGELRALIACDAWGVPLYGNFPIHRLSHDHFTDWSSRLLGAGSESFYADPPVEHLDLWKSPHTAEGWWVQHDVHQRTTAASFINRLLARYSEAI